ncbi:hypothetical protein CK203_044124 [Vitis vinifera]|uniref:Uncharacterized protein n=1 Tax=Vitis vinifera TaxID=29760 RepID=A0A438I2K5_VITVI|nr:hypothetical protein CK203_044124 [Vitis vinifera]
MTTSRPIKSRRLDVGMSGCSLPGVVCEDPGLVGGDGITFYLHGSKDQDFCLVSNANLLRINAHFMGTRNPNLTRDFTGWEEPIVKEPPRDRTVNKTRASRVYALPESLDVQAKIATIIRRLDDLEAKKVQKV